LPAYTPAKKLDKVRYQGRNVFTALSQRRQLDRKYIEAKVEVTAKFAISHHPRQVAMRCSHEPNIHLVSSAAAQTFEFLFLQYAQQFGLQLRRNVADLVKEEGTFIGQLEPAKLLCDCSSKCTFSWPNNSLSRRSSGIAAQFSLMNGRPHRGLIL
jgi:hypothetical protein